MYELLQADGGQNYFLKSIDTSEESIAIEKEFAEEDVITKRTDYLYDHPEEHNYSSPPTDKHERVFFSVGKRKGDIDKGISAVVRWLWKLGCDTNGSCECYEKDGRAYVGFPRIKQAQWFHELLVNAGVIATIDTHTCTYGYDQNDKLDPEKIVKLDTGNVRFPPESIKAATEALIAYANSPKYRGRIPGRIGGD